MENFKSKFGRLKRLKGEGFTLTPKFGVTLRSKGGFTLLEMLIAVSVFTTVATMSAGTLLAVSDAQQKILTLRITQDNISYVIDTTGKEIRTGTSYYCSTSVDDFGTTPLTPSDCTNGGSSFTFLSGGNKVTYQVRAGRMERVFMGGTPSQAISVLTPSGIAITNLKFYVWGSLPASSSDYYQPRVLIIMQGTAGVKERTKSSINIQTMISQRALDS